MPGLHVVTLPPSCGYGDAAVQYLAALDDLGVPVTWTPTVVETGLPLSRGQSLRHVRPNVRDAVERLWHRAVDYDRLLISLPPPGRYEDWLLRERDARPFAYVAWEVDELPATWPPLLNRMERVFVPSEFNRTTFMENGIGVPVHVVPHIAREAKEVPGGPAWGAVEDDDYVFYAIGTWTMRKAMEDTIRAYLEAFEANDPVALIVKTDAIDHISLARVPSSQRDEVPSHVGMVWWKLARILASYPNPPKVHLVADCVAPFEIDRLHTRGDCYLSLTRSEGFGLGSFDAVLFGNPVIITGWGGQLDYLGGDYPYLVRHSLESTHRFHGDGTFLQSKTARWARADATHAAELMRRVFESRKEARDVTRGLRSEVLRRFSSTKIARALAGHLGFEVTDFAFDSAQAARAP